MYGSPEILALGAAERLTPGPFGPGDDNCGCLRREDVVVIDNQPTHRPFGGEIQPARNPMYESPEILEVGPAARLTLGMGPRPESDNCDCTRRDDVIVIDDGGAY